jgi:ABC-type transporter MlaC component
VLAWLLLAATLAADPAPLPAAPATSRPAAARPPGAPERAEPRAPDGATVTGTVWPGDPAKLIRQAERRLRDALSAGAEASALGAIVADYVDYEGLARRSLGSAWSKQPAADRAALVKALRALLEATYLAGLRPGGEATIEVKEVGRTGTGCVLQGTVAAGDRVVPIELKLQRSVDRRPWRVFDATVAGLALLEGYQEQFPQLLALGGMKRLLAQLEQERQEQLRLRAPPPAPPPASR